MNLTTAEFRRKAEAVARGERPTTKVKVKAVIPKPKPRKPARLTRAQAERIDNTLTRIEGALCRTWADAVAYIAKRDGCSASVAGRIACNEFPGLHPARRGRNV